jgi:hypothetical protein
MRVATAIILLLTTACTGKPDAAEVSRLMRQCYDDLEFNRQPFSCEDALKAYRGLDMGKVEPMDRARLRTDEGAVAARMAEYGKVGQ